jgi:deferrochelatase/peroxidase EfeB
VKNSTNNEKRGLLFACYQSSIENGFQHIQQNWCNSDVFPATEAAGIDPIIGQWQPTEKSKERKDSMMTIGGLRAPLLPELVTLKGGEYFFVPSIKALKMVLGQDSDKTP